MGGSQVWQRLLAFLVVAALLHSCVALRPLSSFWQSELPEEKSAPVAVVDNDVDDAEPSTAETSGNHTRRALAGCGTGNPVDDCWRCDSEWESNRQGLADCAIGFGKNAVGGKNGKIYVVTDDTDNDVVDPAPGTLRWGVIQEEPLWIVFSRNMNIKLKRELIMNSYKTIDGRGQNVHIAGGACLTMQFVNNIIVHNVHIHDCKAAGPGDVRSSPSHAGHRGKTDGDGINVFGSRDIWIDHCYFSSCTDGLVDVIEGSNAVTISNSYFENHDKVMLLGAHDGDKEDRNMHVTVAFNHFGQNLVERMPRCRNGVFHVVNNNYEGWGMYAIGGSSQPTVLSEGNRFIAPNGGNMKEVTKKLDDSGDNWRSSGDIFLNGAFFTASGASRSNFYAKATSFTARPAVMVPAMTNDAGPLRI
ncbi:hypothetical protein KC19_8G098400 [Ceratodon purpureus]|uniref:Pectate lyase n=1 Tax=Ceratodon purpureus TaxID=3225 RepID=A0A8T0GWY7_CERPU|nr:hypothetical protein KC19_8G098400 [Ceratodon purpureus]